MMSQSETSGSLKESEKVEHCQKDRKKWRVSKDRKLPKGRELKQNEEGISRKGEQTKKKKS